MAAAARREGPDTGARAYPTLAQSPRDNSPVSPNRRLLFVVLAALALAAPAAVLRAFCLGRSCERPGPATAAVPFCSLPESLRSRIAAGYRDGRTPHVLAVTGETPVTGSSALRDGAWPSLSVGGAPRVPLVFQGTGVRPRAIPSGITLDAVAPTIAEIIGLDRPHPSVRSGQPVSELANGERPRLVVVVVWKGVDSDDLEDGPTDWPSLRHVLEGGAGTLDADPGSLPLDPAAILATIGTGGLPGDHGITGTLLRNDRGELVSAWGEGAPFSVIAGLGDDLDELLGQRPRIGLVGTHVSDRGLIGGNWYIEGDRDDVVILDRRAALLVSRAELLLRSGYGRDGVPDLLAVALDGPVPAMDRALGHLVRAADRASGGSALVVVTSTGPSNASLGGSLLASEVESQVEAVTGPVIEATALGGLFLDQAALAETGITEDRVVRAVRAVRGPSGEPVFADAFPAIAVTFARYC